MKKNILLFIIVIISLFVWGVIVPNYQLTKKHEAICQAESKFLQTFDRYLMFRAKMPLDSNKWTGEERKRIEQFYFELTSLQKKQYIDIIQCNSIMNKTPFVFDIWSLVSKKKIQKIQDIKPPCPKIYVEGIY